MLYNIKCKNILSHISKFFLQMLFVTLIVACDLSGSVEDDDDSDSENKEGFEGSPIINKSANSTKTNNGEPDDPSQSSNSLTDSIKENFVEGFLSILDENKAFRAGFSNLNIGKLILLLKSGNFLNIDFITKTSECMVEAEISILEIIKNVNKYTESKSNVEKIKKFIDLFFKKKVLNILIDKKNEKDILISKQDILNILKGDDDEESNAIKLFSALFISPLQLLQKNTTIAKNYTSYILNSKNAGAVKEIIKAGNKEVLKSFSKKVNEKVINTKNIKNIVPQFNLNEEGKNYNVSKDYKNILDSTCGLISLLLFPHVISNEYSEEDSNERSLNKNEDEDEDEDEDKNKNKVANIIYEYVKCNPKIEEKELKDKINYLLGVSDQFESYKLLEAIIYAIVKNFIFPFVGLLPEALIKFAEKYLGYKNMKSIVFNIKGNLKKYLEGGDTKYRKLKEGDKFIALGVHEKAMHYYIVRKEKGGKFSIIDSDFSTQDKSLDDIIKFMDLSQDKISSSFKCFLGKTILDKGEDCKELTDADKAKLIHSLKIFYGDKFKGFDITLNKSANIIKSIIADDLGKNYTLEDSKDKDKDKDKFNFNYVLIKMS